MAKPYLPPQSLSESHGTALQDRDLRKARVRQWVGDMIEGFTIATSKFPELSHVPSAAIARIVTETADEITEQSYLLPALDVFGDDDLWTKDRSCSPEDKIAIQRAMRYLGQVILGRLDELVNEVSRYAKRKKR